MEKGFTLVELLAVIVILSIIAIITIPMISNVIEKSKLGAMEDSAYGLIEAANYYYAEHMNEMSSNKLFVIENGIGTSEEKLNYKGKIEGNAKILLATSGKVALCITNGKSYAKKEITNSKVVMNTVSSDTTCEINGIDNDSDITIDISGSNSSYYNKNEIDDKLNDIRNDLSNYVTKDELNTLNTSVSDNKIEIDYLSEKIEEVQNKISGNNKTVKVVGAIYANGTAGTYYSNEILEDYSIYIIIVRPTNSGDSMKCTAIIDKFYDSNYVVLDSSGHIGLKLTQSWGFGYILKLI